MPRGGVRDGAGGISKWKHGKTKTIRVPEVLADQILAIARHIDANPQPFEPVTGSNIAVTGSNVIDLSSVQLTHINGEIAVRLEDLVGLGFTIQPQSLAEMVSARIRRKYRR